MKFYKILNENETHNDLKYKTGLNVDPVPFQPEGDCEPGGIYFSAEDIFAFLDYGCWIREVTIPEGDEVYENPGTPKKFKAHRVILDKRKKINLSVFKTLVDEGADVHAGDDYALRWASARGHLDTVKFLVEQGANVHADNDFALRWASGNGHLDIVKFLVEQGADVHAGDDHALKWASGNGHLDTVKFLVEQGADVHADNDFALRWASRNGHLDVVGFLKTLK